MIKYASIQNTVKYLAISRNSANESNWHWRNEPQPYSVNTIHRHAAPLHDIAKYLTCLNETNKAIV